MSTGNAFLDGIIAAGGNTGGTKGPSLPAGQSTPAPVMAPTVVNPYGLADFSVTDGVTNPDGSMDFSNSDFDATLFVSATVNGVTYKAPVNPYSCAKVTPALAMLVRLNQLPGLACTLTSIVPVPPNQVFHPSGMALAYQFTTPDGRILETNFAGMILIEYLHLGSVAADRLMVATYGPAGTVAKQNGFA